MLLCMDGHMVEDLRLSLVLATTVTLYLWRCGESGVKDLGPPSCYRFEAEQREQTDIESSSAGIAISLLLIIHNLHLFLVYFHHVW